MSRRQTTTRTSSNPLRSYLSHHWVTFGQSLKRLGSDRLQTALTSTVVAIAIALPAALYLSVENVARLVPSAEQPARVAVYAQIGIDQQALAALRRELEKRAELVDLSFTSSAQALQEMAQSSSFSSALASLPDNPLPALFEMTVNLDQLALQIQGEDSAERLKQLRSQLAALPNVAEVDLDVLWLQRLHAILQLARELLGAAALVLLLGVVVVIGNSVKMAIDHRREEIVVIKWVGGTDSYVRRPFLYIGALYGLLGALLALASLYITTAVINVTASDLAALYQSQFSLRGPTLSEALVLLTSSVLVGTGAAAIAVTGQLRQIAPE